MKEDTLKMQNKKWLLINILGGGFTKPIDRIYIKIGGILREYQVEVYKKRERDLRKILKNYEKRERDLGEILENYEKRERDLGEILENNIDSKLFSIMVQIALNLKKFHSLDLVHADLKPENIFITNDNVAKISDLGFSGIKEAAGKMVGTTEYMSPESLNNSIITKESDIYSYGIMLLEVFSGKKADDIMTIFNDDKVLDKNSFANYRRDIKELKKTLKNKIDGKEETKLKVKLSEIIESANLERFFPNINLEQNSNIKENIKKQFLELFQGLLQVDQEERFSTTVLVERLAEIADMAKGIKKGIDENIDLEKDMGFRKNDLMDLGYLSEEAKYCLKFLSDYKENKNNFINTIDSEVKKYIDSFYKNINYLKAENKEEYSFIYKKIEILRRLDIIDEIDKIKEKNMGLAKRLENYFYKVDLKNVALENLREINNILYYNNNYKNKFKEACINGDIITVVALINNEDINENINKTNLFGKTLLYNILEKEKLDKNDIEIAKLLIKNGANFGNKTNIKNNVIDNLKLITKSEVEINSTNANMVLDNFKQELDNTSILEDIIFQIDNEENKKKDLDLLKI